MNVRDWMNQQGFYPEQAKFVNEVLASLMCSDLDPDKGDNLKRYENLAQVISTHHAWSKTYPVYSLHREDKGIRIILRRATDWKMSVIIDRSDVRPIDLSCLCRTTAPTRAQKNYGGNELNSVYFEGFPSDLVFGYYEQNRRKFSLMLGSDFAVWTAMFLILSSVGICSVKTHSDPPPGH